MHLYRRQPEAVECPSCGKWWKTGDVRCLVLHDEGGCCHYGDTEADPPEDDDYWEFRARW